MIAIVILVVLAVSPCSDGSSSPPNSDSDSDGSSSPPNSDSDPGCSSSPSSSVDSDSDPCDSPLLSIRCIVQHNYSEDFFNPLYDNADVTICGAICAVMQFCTSNNLTYSAIEDLLKLLRIFCPSPNHLPKSLYSFKKFFEQFNPIHSHEQLCSECFKSKDKCSCVPLATNATAHLVNVKNDKPLEVVLSSKPILTKLSVTRIIILLYIV